MPDGLPEVPVEIMESIGDAVEGVTTPVETAAPETNQVVQETTATPEGQATEETATDAPDSFTKLDPNALPPEARPFYDSMLADYTRKTQEASPWRKLGEELGVSSPDEFRQAAELFAYLQDENNVREFAARLNEALGQAAEPATKPEATSAADEFANLDDPAVAQLRSEINALREEQARRDAAQQQEAMRWALLGEMNRQEAIVKESHPDWGDSEGENVSDEWRAVWNLAPTFNGDVVKAAEVVAAVQNAANVRLLNSKATAASTEGLVAPAPPRVAADAPSDVVPDPELRHETAQAVEFLRGVVNNSE